MLESSPAHDVHEAETEFRRRLAVKLSARGYAGADLDRKIEALLRKGVRLRLNVDEILDDAAT